MVGVGHGRHVVSDARHPGKQIVLDFFHWRRGTYLQKYTVVYRSILTQQS